ncbi:MAG: hypothetical protein KF809_14960 [Chloroflexi bacterium]|nr:hypothetical protein [Chloroflexota bacterium]
MTSHPRLAQVLGAAFRDADLGSWGRTHHDYPGNGLSLARAMIPDIADRLERALDECQRCGWPEFAAEHDQLDGAGGSHPYQPLVSA